MKSASELLTDDFSGQGLKSLQEELFEMNFELKRNMDKGLSYEEMAVANAYRQAISDIESVLDEVHAKMNQ